jgi:hypothetical protein
MERVDAAISYHLAELVRLRRLRNTYAGASSLPPELLLPCFDFLIQYGILADEEYSQALLTLPSVCSHWRSVSLQDGSLWATFRAHPELKPCLTRLMLKRAADWPLSLQVGPWAHQRQVLRVLRESSRSEPCFAFGLSQITFWRWKGTSRDVETLVSILLARQERDVQLPEVRFEDSTTVFPIQLQQMQCIFATGVTRVIVKPWNEGVPEGVQNAVVYGGELVLS